MHHQHGLWLKSNSHVEISERENTQLQYIYSIDTMLQGVKLWDITQAGHCTRYCLVNPLVKMTMAGTSAASHIYQNIIIEVRMWWIHYKNNSLTLSSMLTKCDSIAAASNICKLEIHLLELILEYNCLFSIYTKSIYSKSNYQCHSKSMTLSVGDMARPLTGHQSLASTRANIFGKLVCW